MVLLALVVGALAAAPLGAQVVGIQLGDSARVTVAPGARIGIPLRVDLSAAGSRLSLASLAGTLSWGTIRLTFDSVRVNPASGFTQTANTAGAATGSAVLSYFSTTRLSATAALATAWFTASSTAGGTRVVFVPSAAGSEGGGSILAQLTTRAVDVCVGASGRWGDVNDDGTVSVIDAQQIARHSVGLSVASAAAVAARGDVNADNTVSVIDAQQIARFSVGLTAATRINTALSAPPTVATLAVTPATATAMVGQTLALAAVARDAAGTELGGCVSVTYSSSAPAVATVGADGTVTAVSAGSATVTVQAGARTVTVPVTVTQPTVSVSVGAGVAPGAVAQLRTLASARDEVPYQAGARLAVDRLADQRASGAVFALNANGDPLLAGTAQGATTVLDGRSTALTFLRTALAPPFLGPATPAELEARLTAHPRFADLERAILAAAAANRTYLDDSAALAAAEPIIQDALVAFPPAALQPPAGLAAGALTTLSPVAVSGVPINIHDASGTGFSVENRGWIAFSATSTQLTAGSATATATLPAQSLEWFAIPPSLGTPTRTALTGWNGRVRITVGHTDETRRTNDIRAVTHLAEMILKAVGLNPPDDALGQVAANVLSPATALELRNAGSVGQAVSVVGNALLRNVPQVADALLKHPSYRGLRLSVVGTVLRQTLRIVLMAQAATSLAETFLYYADYVTYKGANATASLCQTEGVFTATCEETFTYALSPQQSFLRRETDDVSSAPFVVNLATLGVRPGDRIRLVQLGDYAFSIHDPAWVSSKIETGRDLHGVFSSSSTVLGSTQPRRVSGAIGIGRSATSPATLFQGLVTDIPEDFSIVDETVTVPSGAAFLLLGVPDSWTRDNADSNGNFGIRITVTRG